MTLEEAKLAALKEEALRAETDLSSRKVNQATAFAGGFNESLIDLVGLPAEIPAAGMRALGMEGVQPTERLKELARQAGFIKDESIPETAGERAGKVFGAAAGFALPVMKAGQGAVETIRTGKSLFEPILQTFRTNPRAFAAAEVASTTGAAVVGEVARQSCPEGLDPDTCAMLGEIAGGISGPAIGAAGQKLITKTPTYRIIKNTLKAIPITKVGKKAAMKDAATIIQSITDDNQRALRQAAEFEPIEGTSFTFAELAGDDQLLLFQKALENSDAHLRTTLEAKRAATNTAIKEHIKNFNYRGESRIEALKDFYALRFEQVKSALDDRLTVAADNAQKRIERIAPKMRRDSASTIINDELLKALGDARSQEKVIWNAIDETERVGLRQSKNVFDEIIGTETNIPDFVRSFFSKSVGKVRGQKVQIKNFKDIKEFRTRMNNAREVARRAGDFERVHFLNELDDAVLEDVSQSAISGEVENAIRFSSELNQRFTKGRIGEVLRFTKGGRRFEGEEISEQLFPASPVKSAKGVEATRKATTPIEGMTDTQSKKLAENRKNIFGATQEVIKNRLFNDTGEFNLTAARAMVRRKDEFLEKFPTLRDAVRNAVDDQENVDALRKTLDTQFKSMTDARQHALGVAMRAGDNPETIMPNILKSANRRKIMTEAVNDTVGNDMAFGGLQDSYLNELYSSALTRQLDVTGKPVVSGRLMEQFHKQYINDINASKLFNKEELKRIDRIINNAKRIDEVLGSTEAASQTLLENNRLIDDFIIRVIGANLGGQISQKGQIGAGLVAAEAGSRLARMIAEKIPHKTVIGLLTEAVRDPQVFRDLMQEVTTPAVAEKVAARLHAWIAALGLDAPEQLDEAFNGITIPITQDANDLRNEQRNTQ